MAEQGGSMPDPGGAKDLAEFVALLAELRAWAGMPSYRVLAKRVEALIRPPRAISPSTLVNVFKTGRQRLDLDLVVALVRALGASEAAVDGWRRACIKVHAQAKTGGPVGAFRQLPADLRTFTGRQEELAQLIAAATHHRDIGGARTVVVSAIEGMAGVGKTQLAIHAAHQLVRLGHFTDVQLHVNLRGFDPELPPADPSAVLEAFLRHLGVPAQQIPTGVDERAAMYRNQLHERSAIILLDNAADEDQVRDLIPASPTCLVLITSRRSLVALDGAFPHQLDVFTETESLDLLSQIAGPDRVASEPEAAAQIAEYCGHLPLAVSLAAARLRSRPTWTLQHLADKLRAGRLTAIRAEGRALRPAFNLSYQELDAPLRRVFRLLGHHPGPDTTPAHLAALADITAEQAEDALEQLQDEHLLAQPAPGRYELHDLLRLLAAELAATEPEPEPVAPLTRLVSWCVATGYAAAALIGTPNLTGAPAQAAATPGFESYDDALTWFDQERNTLAAVQRAAAEAGLSRHVWQLAETQKQFFVVRRHLDDFLAAQQLALVAARADGDRRTEAQMLTVLGGTYWMAGRLDDSEDCCLQVRSLYQALGDVKGEASALIAQGVVQNHRGHPESSVDLIRQALALLDGPDTLHLRGQALMNRAVVYKAAQHRRPQDVADLREALMIFQRVGDRPAEALALGNLADFHLVDASLDLALGLYREQQRLARELADAYIEAESLRGAGDVHAAAHRTAQARQAWTEALALYEKIEHPKAAEARQRLQNANPPRGSDRP